MTEQMLSKARRYEEEKRREAESSLPVYHLTGGAGWINDPNGFALGIASCSACTGS